MNAKVNVKYGEATYQFEFDEKDEKDTLNKIITFGNPPRYCDVCRATDGFYFSSNRDKEGNIYVNAKCKCGARAKLGSYKVGGYFWHDFETVSDSIKKAEPDKAVTASDEVNVDDLGF